MANEYAGARNNGGAGGVALPEALMDVYSLDILHEAMGIMRYEEFAVYRDDLMASPGETVQFTKYADLTRGGELTEGDPIETKSMAASQTPLTVKEWGNGVKVSERLLITSWDNVLGEAAVLLGRDYAVVRDLSIRDVVKASGTTLFTNPDAAALADVTIDDKFDVETLRRAVEQLQTVNAPKFYGDFYVCFIHPHQAAYLKRDPDWVNAQLYAGSRALFNGEIGRWEDVVFIVTTQQGNGAAASTAPGYEAALHETGADDINLYRATMIADQAFGLADALPVEMRDGGIEDFGRQHKIAWYALYGVGVLNSAHIIQIISA